MGRIILVRHGETEWNKDGRYQGHCDVALSDLGREQARSVAERLSREPIAAVYASDLARAYETAQAIAARHGLPVEPVRGLREIDFGHWEGQRKAEIAAAQAELFAAWQENPLATRLPGGESVPEVQTRALAAVAAIAARHPAETAVVVAHGGAICALLCHYRQCSFWECLMGNTGISVLEFGGDGKVEVVSFNDVAHLAAKKN